MLNEFTVINNEVHIRARGRNEGTIIIDLEDLPLVSKHSWCINNGYAIARVDSKNIKMQYMITGETPSIEHQLDHINRNKLDNRKSNLRFVSFIENMRNRGVRVNNKSGFNGVHFDKRVNKWIANIKTHGVQKRLGYFNTLEEAVEARKQGELLYWRVDSMTKDSVE